MTDDKDFKRLVRSEARRSGQTYTAARESMRPSDPAGEGATLSPSDVAERFDAIVATIETWVYGKHDIARLAALGLVAPGNLLLTAGPGNGMTALGQGLAAAIGGNLVSIDGRTGLDRAETERWRSDDVVVISHFDGLDTAGQVMVVEAGRRPAIILAKRHPLPDRMPFPPDDETRERFLFGGELGYSDEETELRIVTEIRDGAEDRRLRGAVDVADVRRMRAAAEAVDVPEDVRRFIVEVTAATRRNDDLLLGASAVASLGLVRATAAAAVCDGRDRATIDDVRSMLPATLAHRIVPKPGVDVLAVLTDGS